MPEVPPVIKMVLDCILMNVFLYNPQIAGKFRSSAHILPFSCPGGRHMSSMRIGLLLFTAWLATPLGAQAQASQTGGQPSGSPYQLKPTPKTVAWGYYDAKTPPALRVRSGDTVEIQTLVTSSRERFEAAGLWPDRVEPAWREVYEQVKDHGPGPHMLTGPVYVEGAEPGDVLEVRIQKIQLAIPYAINAFSPGRGFL